MLLTGHQQQLTNAGAIRHPAADSTADVTGGAHHSHLGLRQIDAKPGRVLLHLTADHPGRVGVAGGEALPLQQGGADLLELRQVEVLKNDGGEPAQGRDVDPALLGQLHGVLHLARRRFETAEHLRHKTRIDIGALDGLTGVAGHLKGFHQLRRSTAPEIELTIGKVLESQVTSRDAGITKTAGVTDQTKHSLTALTDRRPEPGRCH